MNKIQIIEQQAVDNKAPSEVADSIIKLKRISEHILEFKPRIDGSIDNVLFEYKKTRGGASGLATLGKILNDTNEGKLILKEHKSFEGVSLSLFNQKLQKHGIDYVLEHLDGTLISKEKLRKRYDEFWGKYEAFVKHYLKAKNMNLEPLITHIISKAGKPNYSKGVAFNNQTKTTIPELMAGIFALWTLKNAIHYFEAEGQDNRTSFLLQPHAAQVISIFRILCIGDKDEKLQNNLVQIGTGEGKSITLAVTSMIFALLGFRISCACYSEYLSKRDYESFLPIFQALNLLEYIKYGTFNKLCEQLINQNMDIRTTVETLITENKIDLIQNEKLLARPQLLLIDEVDVFFCKDFYGNAYRPCSTMKDKTISELQDYIWNSKNSKISLTQLKTTAQYQACCQRFKGWEQLIEEVSKDMLYDIKSFDSEYEVKDDKIGYKDQDTIVFNISYGYKTLYAYYNEHQNGKISQFSLDQNKGFKIKCGDYSFAEIPHVFNFIMGVTGTLKTLSEPEREVVEKEYKILRYTYMPSVFGANNFRFNEINDVFIETKDDYLIRIVKEIDDRMQGKTPDTKRAILVFFESQLELQQFNKCKAFEQYKDAAKLLTESASLEEKESIIKHATGSGQVTILTKAFARGTDFQVLDQIVSKNGGVHVIQTFLSEEFSEEIQTKGRTARQGESGTYSLVLLDKSLEKFLIRQSDLKDHAVNLYKFINEKRNLYFKDQYENNKKYIQQVSDLHKRSQQFVESIKSENLEQVKQFLIEQNKGPSIIGEIKPSRTLVIMDATGSMSGMLSKAKTQVSTMFQRATEILQEKDINASCVQIQFAVYRSYSSQENEILEVSPWETKPDNLRQFMEKITAKGGTGPGEAVEIGLWHANFEHTKDNISQVILIGDAPCNEPNEIISHRSKYSGETYWSKTKFGPPTSYQAELAKLKAQNLPVHAFYINDYAIASFIKMASLSAGGKSEFLNVNDTTKGAERLTNMVTEEILRNVGQQTGRGEEFVTMYRAKYYA